jgi:hypothetical protein
MSKTAVVAKEVVQVVAEMYTSGNYHKELGDTGTYYVRAKVKCPVCHRWHVFVADGEGMVIPEMIDAVCPATGERLIVKAWNPSEV